MADYFFWILLALVLTELIKGLSANGTPPVLQRFSWQIDLAYIMWSNIVRLRIIYAVALVLLLVMMSPQARQDVLPYAAVLVPLWGGIYWLFNRFWVGKYKFLPITQRVFETAANNKVDPAIQVLGISHNGVQKAYPTNMLFYHHQISDEIGDHPIAATYCGMCRSGRIYSALVDDMALSFSLVGAVNFNAVLRDDKTATWWRQETGEAAKGVLKGRVLDDMPFEQMSLANWIAKYPETTILQYDPHFTQKYKFLAALLNYEVSFPGWHMQKTPPLVIGIEVGGQSHAYDFKNLMRVGLVLDTLADTAILAVGDQDGVSAFVYDRTVDGTALSFQRTEEGLKDHETGSQWDMFGRCHKGKLKGKTLRQIQSHKQFVRAWITFHPQSSFYNF